MLFKFQKNLRFLVNFQQALETIASFGDDYKESLETKIKTSGMDQKHQESVSITSILRKIREDFVPSIKENILNLKFSAVSFAQKLYDLFNSVSAHNAYTEDSYLADLINPRNLAKIFIQFTLSKELIERVSAMVDSQKPILKEEIDFASLDDSFTQSTPPHLSHPHGPFRFKGSSGQSENGNRP